MIITKNTENIIFINLSSCQGLFKQTKFGSEKNSPVSDNTYVCVHSFSQSLQQ
jgi:hypothetical protein